MSGRSASWSGDVAVMKSVFVKHATSANFIGAHSKVNGDICLKYKPLLKDLLSLHETVSFKKTDVQEVQCKPSSEASLKP